MKSQYFTRITLSALPLGIMSASASLNAATVPAGTELAEKQELVEIMAVNLHHSIRIKSKAMLNSTLSAIYSKGWWR
jgi:hypothetical protein